MTNAAFELTGVRPGIEEQKFPEIERKHLKKGDIRKQPILSVGILGSIITGCLFAEVLMTKDPKYMDLLHYSQAPCLEFLFGTDTMGRDLFSMIWYGGRLSLLIGVLSTLLSTTIAVMVGAFGGLAPDWLDRLLMRVTEIFFSIPSLLLVVFFQSILGKANVLSLSLVIGLTSWMGIAKVVRTEVCQIRDSEYVTAARSLGAGFFHILRKHLIPNVMPSVQYMVIMNIRSAMLSEATLSFMGIGLPVETITWGSMLSLSEKAMLSGCWWIILIPGVFLAATMLCLTNIGNALQKKSRKENYFRSCS